MDRPACCFRGTRTYQIWTQIQDQTVQGRFDYDAMTKRWKGEASNAQTMAIVAGVFFLVLLALTWGHAPYSTSTTFTVVGHGVSATSGDLTSALLLLHNNTHTGYRVSAQRFYEAEQLSERYPRRMQLVGKLVSCVLCPFSIPRLDGFSSEETRNPYVLTGLFGGLAILFFIAMCASLLDWYGIVVVIPRTLRTRHQFIHQSQGKSVAV